MESGEEWIDTTSPTETAGRTHTWSHAMTMMDLLSHVAPSSSNDDDDDDDDETSRHDYDRISFLPLMRHRKPLK